MDPDDKRLTGDQAMALRTLEFDIKKAYQLLHQLLSRKQPTLTGARFILTTLLVNIYHAQCALDKKT